MLKKVDPILLPLHSAPKLFYLSPTCFAQQQHQVPDWSTEAEAWNNRIGMTLMFAGW